MCEGGGAESAIHSLSRCLDTALSSTSAKYATENEEVRLSRAFSTRLRCDRSEHSLINTSLERPLM